MDEQHRIETQTLKTPAGDELVVISRRDYEALLVRLADAEEELEDIAAASEARAEAAATRLPPFPPEVNAALFRGDRRLAAIRKWRGFAVADLAAKAGVGAGDIEAFERGEREQTVDQARLLAVALDVHPGWLEP